MLQLGLYLLHQPIDLDGDNFVFSRIHNLGIELSLILEGYVSMI